MANMIKKNAASVALLIASVLFSLVAAEMIFRAYLSASPDTTKPPVQHPHPKYGWHVIPDITVTGRLGDMSGQLYDIDYGTNEHGFRSWGDVKSKRPKILVLGDSHTHGEFISNEKLYYAKLSEIGEIFAYGNGGFGNLQELMMLEDFLSVIKPDVIVWQLSSNDIVNNSYELEFLSVKDNNGLRRPYLEDGNIVYRLPKPLPGLRWLGANHSKLLYYLLSRWDMRQALDRFISNQTLFHLLREGEHQEKLQRAANATATIMSAFVGFSGDVPIYAFIADADPPMNGFIYQIVTQLGIEQIDVQPMLTSARDSGEEIFTFDGIHWNNLGHQIVGMLYRCIYSSTSLCSSKVMLALGHKLNQP